MLMAGARRRSCYVQGAVMLLLLQKYVRAGEVGARVEVAILA